MTVLKRLGIQFLGTTVLFSAMVGLGTSLVLFAASIAGYLSYSDRPGPGWLERLHWPSLGEAGVYLSFAPWFAYFCLFFGAGLFALSLVLGFASSPNWLNRIIGGVVGAGSAGLAVAGAGWYVALAELGPDVAIGIGFVYGIFFFSRFVHSGGWRLPIWIRIFSISGSFALFVFWIVSPFLPRKPVHPLSVQLNRLTPGDSAYLIKDERPLGADISRQVALLGLRGDIHGGSGSFAGGGNSEQPTDVLLIATEPISQTYRLAIPNEGYAVYLLKDHQWTVYPAIKATDKRQILIEPGVDRVFEGGRLRISDEKDFSSFTWYPTISLSR
jgi:MFS family permease